MHRKVRAVLSAMVFVVSGCAQDLTAGAKRQLPLHIEKTHPIYIVWARSSVEGDNVRIWGRVRLKPGTGPYVIRGRVNIAIHRLDGTQIAEVAARVSLKPQSRWKPMEATFSEILEIPDADQCMIKVAYER